MYVLTAADDQLTLRVRVSGTNSNGTTTLSDSGATNPIIPLPATQTSPPTLLGDAYVGSSLVGGVGTWASPATWWTRQWEQCQPDGSQCTPIQGETSPEYVARAGDYGMRIRLHVTASVVPPNHLPLPVDAYSPLSAVIAYPPGVTPPTTTTTTTSTTPTPPNPPTSAPNPPRVGRLALTHRGHRTLIAFNVSASGSITIALVRAGSGHLAHGHCVTPKLKHRRRCSLYLPVYSIHRIVIKAGRLAVTLPTRVHGRALPPGNYRLIVTPATVGGIHGSPRSLDLTLRLG
jgi:hypothetical protein